eukprot:14386696-Alexandrium_andersonii.AAC.1
MGLSSLTTIGFEVSLGRSWSPSCLRVISERARRLSVDAAALRLRILRGRPAHAKGLLRLEALE